MNALGFHLCKKHPHFSNYEYYMKYINQKDMGVCYCGKKKKFISFSRGFSKTCSIKCFGETRKGKYTFSPPVKTRECVGCNKTFLPAGHSQKWCSICRPKGLPNQKLSKYNLTQPELDNLIKKQKGKCALCDKAYAVIDHCHKTGKVRGLLCYLCNNTIDRISIAGWVEKAELYLENYRK
jgi:hypothetical protein